MFTLGLLFSMVGWITIMNPEGVRNGNGIFLFGDTCVVHSTKQVNPITMSEHGMLYRIEATPTPAYGTACPAGTLFFMQPDAFQVLREKEETKTQTQQKLRHDVQELLK
jgi:hypothetical protein